MMDDPSAEPASKGGFLLRLKLEQVPATFQLRFAQPQVRKSEVLSALREIIKQIEASSDLLD